MRLVRRPLVCAGSALVLAASFLPWVRVGSRDRSSYVLADILDRLELAPNGPAAWSLRLWPVIPLLLVGTVVAAWAARPVVTAVVGVVAGIYTGMLAWAVEAAPVETRIGTLLALVGAPIVAVAALAHLVPSRRAG